MINKFTIAFTILAIFLLANLFLIWKRKVTPDCEIDPKCPDSPLLIYSNREEIMYPLIGSKTIRLKYGEPVDFVCPASKVLLMGQETNQIMPATCNNKVYFSFPKYGLHRWKHISCKGVMKANTTMSNDKCIGGTQFKTGFALDDDRFIPVLTSCLNENNRTLYTRHVVRKIIENRDILVTRPFFETHGGNYHMKTSHLNIAYIKQLESVNQGLGLDPSSSKYVKNDRYHYFSRGHLACRADFFYAAEQNATFHYMNSAPQWAGFNVKNWKVLENAIRRYAITNKTDLIVWTGTNRVLTMLSERTRQPTRIYLHGKNATIPIPLVFWKMVYRADSKRGVVFLGINDVYATDKSKFQFCPDITEKISWIQLRYRSLMENGFTYACSIASFRHTFPKTPYVKTAGVLYN